MYLFITTQPAPDHGGGFFATAKHGPRTVEVAAESHTEAAQLCALRFFFGDGHTPDSINKIILTETCRGQYMARLATANDLPKNVQLQPPPTRTI